MRCVMAKCYHRCLLELIVIFRTEVDVHRTHLYTPCLV